MVPTVPWMVVVEFLQGGPRKAFACERFIVRTDGAMPPLLHLAALAAMLAAVRFTTSAATDYKSRDIRKRSYTIMDTQTEIRAELADDFLFGAEVIAVFMTDIGLPTTVNGIYYAYKKRSLPIGKYGKCLISSKKKLTRAVQAIINATADEPLRKRENGDHTQHAR
jgi:hypothetical protein